MKKIALLIAVFSLFAALGAQTGLFELSFGDDYESCEYLLDEAGLELSNDNGDIKTFVAFDNEYVEFVELQFNVYDDELEGWTVYYIPQDDFDIEEDILGILEDWHGEDYERYEDEEYYVWELDNNHLAEAFWDYDLGLFVVNYY